jgi:hypothetical protein
MFATVKTSDLMSACGILMQGMKASQAIFLKMAARLDI